MKHGLRGKQASHFHHRHSTRIAGCRVKLGASGKVKGIGNILANVVSIGRPIVAACCSMEKIVFVLA